MKNLPVKKNAILYWSVVLALCLICFSFVRPQVDFNSGLSFEHDKSFYNSETHRILTQLNAEIDEDSVSLVRRFLVNRQPFRTIKDTTSDSNIRLPRDIEDGFGIQTYQWRIVVAPKNQPRPVNMMTLEPHQSFFTIRYGNDGKVLSFKTANDTLKSTFIEGANAEDIAHFIFEKVFGYSTSDYSILEDSTQAALEFNVDVDDDLHSEVSTNADKQEVIRFAWAKKSSNRLADVYQMELKPRMIEKQQGEHTEIRRGYELSSFKSMAPFGTYTRDELANETGFGMFFIIFLMIQVVLVAILGLRPVIQGRVDWKRATYVFLGVSLAVIAWRFISYMWPVVGLLNPEQFFIFFINNYFYGVAMGLYAALAYIGWWVMARDNEDEELRLVSQIWRLNLKPSPIGFSVVRGMGFGALMLLLVSLILYIDGEFFITYDSEQILVEPASIFPPFTILISSWSTAWIISLAQVALFTSYVREKIKNKHIVVVLSIIFVTFSVTLLNRFFSTPYTLIEDLFLFVPVGIILVIAYNRYGLVTLSSSLFTFMLLVSALPYIDSHSGFMQVNAYFVFGILGLMYIYAVLVAFKGQALEQVEVEIPDYELKYQTQARYVREIEVARQSQMQLMPNDDPKLDGAEVYGFFMPSYEVGGDYYNYYLVDEVSDEGEKSKALAFTLLDVSGKAMRAAIQAVFTSGLLMSRMHSDSPDDILDHIAPMVYDNTDAKTFITCIVGRYNTKTKLLRFANAGHCQPILKRGDDAFYLETPQPRFPLGLRRVVDYHERVVQLEAGDVLLLYSDGLPEAEDKQGRRLGFDTLLKYMKKMYTKGLTAREISEALRRKINQHSQDGRLADDTTVICIKVCDDGKLEQA